MDWTVAYAMMVRLVLAGNTTLSVLVHVTRRARLLHISQKGTSAGNEMPFK